MLHVICTRLHLGHLSVYAGDSSRPKRSEKIVKNFELRFECNYYYYYSSSYYDDDDDVFDWSEVFQLLIFFVCLAKKLPEFYLWFLFMNSKTSL